MNQEERSAAVFGSFDGVVSIVGFIFALLLSHSSNHLIALGALGGAISATVSMAAGEFESAVGKFWAKARGAISMGIATLLGSLVPVWGFFFFPRTIALWVAGVGSALVALWIGYEKHKGVRGYLGALGTLLGACLITLLIVSLLPAAGG